MSVTDGTETAPVVDNVERDITGAVIHRDVMGNIIDPETGQPKYAENATIDPITGQPKYNDPQDKQASGQTMDAAGKTPNAHDPDSNAAHSDQIKQRIETLASALPHDGVGETVVRDYVNPVILGGNVDRYSANKVLATIADFENAPARSGQIEGEAFNLKGLEAMQGLKGLGLIAKVEDMPSGFGASDIHAAALSGEAATNVAGWRKAKELEQQQQITTHELPPLGGKNSANA